MQIKRLIACLTELKLKRTPSISIHNQTLVWPTFLFSAVQHQKKRPYTSLNDLFLRTNFSLKDAELSTLLASSRFHWDVRFCMCYKELQCATWRVVRKPFFNDMSATKLSLNRTWFFCKIWTLTSTKFGIRQVRPRRKLNRFSNITVCQKWLTRHFSWQSELSTEMNNPLLCSQSLGSTS